MTAQWSATMNHGPIHFDLLGNKYFVWVSYFGIKVMKYFETAVDAGEFIRRNHQRCFEVCGDPSNEQLSEFVRNAREVAEGSRDKGTSKFKLDEREASRTYGKDSRKKSHDNDTFGSNTHYRIFVCPSCAQKLRVSIPLIGSRVICQNCRSALHINTDEFGNFYVTLQVSSAYGSTPKTVEDCFRLLEIPNTSSASDIRRAYRKKMQEYHPDRVAHLGDKLKKVAEAEASNLNAAIEILNANGFKRDA